MWRSISSQPCGRWRIAISVALSESWMLAKCAHISAPGGGSGSQFSSNSTPRNSVPSEPASSRQRLNGLVRRRIEDGALHQPVERVAGVAAGDGGLGKVVADELAVGRVAEQIAHRAVDFRLERVGSGAFGGELRRRERAEGRRASRR